MMTETLTKTQKARRDALDERRKPHTYRCRKCGEQAVATGEREHPYNGGSEYFKCPKCGYYFGVS